jgi:hypothetical protein
MLLNGFISFMFFAGQLRDLVERQKTGKQSMNISEKSRPLFKKQSNLQGCHTQMCLFNVFNHIITLLIFELKQFINFFNYLTDFTMSNVFWSLLFDYSSVTL